MRRGAALLAAGLAVLSAPLPFAGARAPQHSHAGPTASVRAKTAALDRDRAGARSALARVNRLRTGRGVRTGREMTLALHALSLRLGALEGAERRGAQRRLARPTDGASDPNGGYTVPRELVERDCADEFFCVHWVDVAGNRDAVPDLSDSNGASDGDGVPDYVEAVQAELATTRAVENGALGWPAPISDGLRGGDGRTDVYIMQLGDQGIFGYAAADAGQPSARQSAYLVLDNDYATSEYPAYSDPRLPLQVTVAHEYNHVLQYGMDALQDGWLFESTAVWMEDQVYDAVDDYLNYLPRWVGLSALPLTHFDLANPTDETNVKAYGNAVFNTWISERFGPDAIRDVWASSLTTSPASFAPGAYQAALARRGSGFYEELATFAAALPEWRATPAGQPGGRGFSEGAAFPDLSRAGTLAPTSPGGSFALDHTAMALFAVEAGGAAPVTFSASVPPGTAGAVALVGRSGDLTGGTVSSELLALRSGGSGRVTLAGPFDRLTAVVVNADTNVSGYDPARGDWVWTRDGQCSTATIATDDGAPVARLARAREVPVRGPVRALFSEPVSCVKSSGTRLLDERGRTLPAAVTYDPVRRTMAVRPARALRDSVVHRLELGAGLVDRSGLQPARRSFRFRTVRIRPGLRLGGARRQRAQDVARRGLAVTLRSSDRDTLRYSIRVAASSRALSARAARVVGRRSGRLRARRTLRLRVRLSRAARSALRSGRTPRLRVSVTARDPQRNRARRTRVTSIR